MNRSRRCRRARSCRTLRGYITVAGCLLLCAQGLLFRLLFWERVSSARLTRLYPTLPMLIDLRSYSVCHPKELHLPNLTLAYAQDANERTCFLVEDLDGGPWWSYVSQEFAEILTHLTALGQQSNVVYRSFPAYANMTYRTNLTRFFLNACNFDENAYLARPIPIIILLWDINRLYWHQMRDQWTSLLATLAVRVTVFIDDLHFTTKQIHASRQYLFHSVASEIFSTYPYLFHNYYSDIPSSRLTWLPHGASPTARTINQTAVPRLFISGANLGDWYPCRSRAFRVCHHRKDLVACLFHPGYGATMKNESAYFFGRERYPAYMRQFTYGLASCQSVHYAIAKLFELPANGLVLVTTDDLIPILARLHLYHNEHFLTVECRSRNGLVVEIEDLRSRSTSDIDALRRKGQQVVHERHLIQHRAELLHTRLLAQALLAVSRSEQERQRWERWGRHCFS